MVHEGLVRSLKGWLSDFWWWLRDTMRPWLKEEARRVELTDFVNMPLKDLARGAHLGTGPKIPSSLHRVEREMEQVRVRPNKKIRKSKGFKL